MDKSFFGSKSLKIYSKKISFIEFNFLAFAKSKFLDLVKFSFLDLVYFIIVDRFLISLPTTTPLPTLLLSLSIYLFFQSSLLSILGFLSFII